MITDKRYKVIFSRVPRKTFSVLSERIKNEKLPVDLYYEGSDICGQLSISGRTGHLAEYKNLLVFLINECEITF